MKTIHLGLCVAFISLTLVSCADPEAGGPQLSDPDVAALRAATEVYRSAEVANDWEAVAMLYTNDAIRLLPKGPTVVGREAILDEFRSRPGRMIEYQQSMNETRGIGGMAFARGVFTYVVEVAGDTLRGSGKYLAIYQRQSDGTWLIDRDIFNYDTPVTASD
jgi:ketosteroid isomerase-like protein